MKHNHLLSICIPTYNRVNQLSTLLDGIIELIDPRVDVVISDNGSTDGTFEILEKYSANYPYIKYQRSSKNEGFNENYARVGGMATGKYIWFVGSDDKISQQGINIVLKFIMDHTDVDGFLVNFRACDGSLNDIGESFWKNLNQETELLTNARQAFIKYWHYTGFFSASVLRRDLWNSAMAIIPRKEYPNFVQMIISGYILKNSKSWGFVKDECIMYRSGVTDTLAIFGGRYFRIVNEVAEVGAALRYLTEGDHALTYRAEVIPVNVHTLSLIFSYTQDGMSAVNRLKIAVNLSKYYWRHIYFWLVIIPALFIPKTGLDFIRSSGKRLKRLIRLLK